MIIIGITGTLGAGKGTVVDYLKQHHGFAHFSARDFIVQEIVRRGLPVNRDTMTEVANSLRAEHHSGYIIEQLAKEAQSGKAHAVIESVRTAGEIDILRAYADFYLFAVDAEPHARYERIKARKTVTDFISYEKFIADEEREMQSDDPNKQNLKYCIGHADFVLRNDGSVEELWREVDGIVGKLVA